MTALYLIASEYRQQAEALANLDLDPQTLADTLESLSGDLEVKAQAVAMVIRAIDADAESCKEWSKIASDRAKAAQARANGLRDYLATNMTACGISKIEGPGVRLSFRKSSAVAIDEPGLIPSEFMRQPETPPPAPDKNAIGDALKAGKEVPGAHIEHRTNLVIS